MISLYRVPKNETQPGDTYERFSLGRLRASVYGIPFPVWLAVWWLTR